MWLLYWLDVQPGPADLVSLNTCEGNSFHKELLSIGLRPMIVQFGPDSVSYCHLVEDLYLLELIRENENILRCTFPHIFAHQIKVC